MTEVAFSDGSTRLCGSLSVPSHHGDHPALVFLHGSGPATREDWSDEGRRLAAAGIATLAYDKPGSGSSQGDWTQQTFEDRAREALAALRFLCEQRGVDATRVGLLGMSQGAWIAPMAAAQSNEVAFVVALSASGTGPREQDRFRVERQLASEGFPEADIREALGVWSERDEGLRRGDSVEALVALQRGYGERRWYPHLAFDDPSVLRFIQRIWDFDPAPYLERCRCPLLAVWGEADVIVDADDSRAAFEAALRTAGNQHFSLVVIPGLGHGLGAEENGRICDAVFELMTDWILSVPAPQTMV